MHTFLRRWLPYKDLGWLDIGEVFTRFQLIKTRWFSLYLHRLDCPREHPHCHDHPWWFVTLILWGGYWEKAYHDTSFSLPYWRWQRPGKILYRPAEWKHSVITPVLPNRPMWSLVLVGPKSREWGFKECH